MQIFKRVMEKGPVNFKLNTLTKGKPMKRFEKNIQRNYQQMKKANEIKRK